MSSSTPGKKFVRQAEATARDERAIQKRIDKLDQKQAPEKPKPTPCPTCSAAKPHAAGK